MSAFRSSSLEPVDLDIVLDESNVTNENTNDIGNNENRKYISSTELNYYAINIQNKGLDPRGGSSIIQVNKKIIVFGGVDREQTHFQDLFVYNQEPSTIFKSIVCTGDIPMPRSGHAVACYGHIMFLFGGIDFTEEAVYNDLYALNTETFHWYYVGEAGYEIIARNSHSLAVISSPKNELNLNPNNYLVIYGGASPEHGPMGDTYYALLPELLSLDLENIFVTWISLKDIDPNCAYPSNRELHGSSYDKSRLIISGGRDESGQILSDVWELTISNNSDKNNANEETNNLLLSSERSQEANFYTQATPLFQWKRFNMLELHIPRCTHTQILCENQLILFGGFTGDGQVSGELIEVSLNEINNQTVTNPLETIWTVQKLSKHIIPRFGHCMCLISKDMVVNLINNSKYSPLFRTEITSKINDMIVDNGINGKLNGGMVLFGGVCIEKDFNDVWLLV
eukprot:gene13494-18105_t